MRTVKIIQNGKKQNSKKQTIELPADMAYEGLGELAITKEGDVITLRPVRPSWRSLRDLPNLQYVELEENHLDLSDATVQADLQYLRGRGVTVEVEPQLPKAVKDLQGEMATLRDRLDANPNDAQANFLYAFELLLNLFEDGGANSLKATAVSACQLTANWLV